MRISDLPLPVKAIKSNWMPATRSLDFTPPNDSGDSLEKRKTTISHQFHGGLVVEYIAKNLDSPNEGFENDPDYLNDLGARGNLGGRLVAVHRLRPSARKLWQIIGKEQYEKHQDMWAKNGLRNRWSLAFPIIESYQILGDPLATTIFDEEELKRIFAHSSSTLRTITDEERMALNELEIEAIPAHNLWIALEDEFEMAEGSSIPAAIVTNIEIDLASAAMEGMTEEQKRRVKKRAAWLANRYAAERRKQGTFKCDDCNFDPTSRTAGTSISPRSLIDVHHRNPIEEGIRYTQATSEFYQLLCPLCHRFEHARLRAEAL
jgi:5-methylcytosine-specific restriction protein A